MGKVVQIDCEKSMKLETSRNVTKSKRSLHWCRSISKKYLCTFYYSISQKVITLSGRRFITVSGGFITLSGSYYSIGRFYYIIGQLLQYRAFITLSVGTGLFVSRLAPSTSASALRRHIKDSCDVTVTCVSIKTKFDSYCSFRVFAEANVERLLTPSVWPSGVLVHEFV